MIIISPCEVQSLTPADRERALLLVADRCRTMQPEPRDLLALADFIVEN